MLIAAGLVVLVVNLRQHNATLRSQKRAPAPKVTVPTNAPEDESLTDGNGRRDDASRRRQGRRTGNDRRKRSIPVEFDRRSGLSRRRSEILGSEMATISSEALDPIAEADVYLSAGSYDHAEATLREALATDPARQELKVKLLQIYHQKGDLLAFNALAEELREVLDGPSSELWKNLEANGWHSNGPTDDAGAAQEEIMLELAEQERANGDAAPDVDTSAEKTEIELDPYTIEFESQPQDHTVVNTLKSAFNEFLQARKGLKARTIENYKQVMEGCFADWHKKTMLEISEDMVAERHQELWQEHGKAYANRAMRCLRTMYNFFSTHYRDASGKPLVPENPVKSLTHIQS
jgi:tetratricopeptide (TPR) repeat protein